MAQFFGMVKDNIFTCNNSNTYTYKKNTYKIAYDANIYSSVILKQELLAKGYYFETCLEEEIILKAFIEYGFKVYNKFSGHFAIVIWNESKKELIFMRDCYCVKSIYYKQGDNGEIIFSNNLIKLLNSTNNVITYDRFVDLYLKEYDIQDGFITNDIKESTKVMICGDSVITKVENINYSEYGYIFDEVAQIVLANLDKICIVKFDNKNSEISVVAEYILNMLSKEKMIISKIFSRKKLSWFLANMSLPFYNLAEYQLVFTKIKDFGLVDVESTNIKRFFNINFFCSKCNIQLALPSFCREKIFGIDEVYLPDYKGEKFNCIDEDLVNKEFKKIEKWIVGDCDYYKKIYFIRLNNWLKKYNIRIVF